MVRQSLKCIGDTVEDLTGEIEKRR